MKSKPVEYGWVIEEVEKHDTGAHEESANDGSLDCCSRIPVSSRFSFPSRHLHNRPCHPTGNCRCKKIVYRLLLSTPDRKATRRCNRTTSDRALSRNFRSTPRSSFIPPTWTFQEVPASPCEAASASNCFAKRSFTIEEQDEDRHVYPREDISMLLRDTIVEDFVEIFNLQGK